MRRCLAGIAALLYEGSGHRHIMNLAQSPHIPAEGTKPSLRDAAWLVPVAARGFVELVRARVAFARLEAKAIPLRNQAAKRAASDKKRIGEATLARMAYVLPRLSDRLPWRSDCLVQAIAAQNWLASMGAAGEIQIGVENPADGNFGAHAWLMHEGQVVTGGDISRYDLIYSDSRAGRHSDATDEKAGPD